MDLDAVRTFVAVTEAGRFSDAADDMSVTQQAVSKRVAALEKDLAVRLLPARRAASSSPSTARRSCRTPAISSAPASGPPTPCVPAGARCAST